MAHRSDDKYILYPLYFDDSRSRKQGRRVSLDDCIEKPSIEQIAKAAQSLGLHPILEKDACHPSHHWKQDGRVLVDKKDSKEKTLQLIAQRF
jgi:signal recognition particle subunit SRP19